MEKLYILSAAHIGNVDAVAVDAQDRLAAAGDSRPACWQNS
jgi:hypothetical protein